MIPTISRKTVEEYLDLWADAEKKRRSISFDDYGDVHLVYPAVAQHAPTLEHELKKRAVITLISKIQTEIRALASTERGESAERLLMQLPSLGQFSASGKIGNLREEWKKLKTNHAETVKKTAIQRQEIFNEFKEFLPKIPARTDSGGTTILRHEFNSSEHQDLIKNQIYEVNKYKLNDQGYYRPFLTDLPRSRWSIEIEGKTQSFGLGQTQEKLAAIANAFGHDQSALSTASKLLNQVAPSFVTVPLHNLFPTHPDLFLRSNQSNGEETFYKISSDGHSIKFESDTYSKVDTVVLNPDEKNERVWPVNQDEQWKGNPGPKNYGQHYRLSIQIDKQAASQGKIKLAEGIRIEASAEFRLCPSLSDP